VHSSNREKGGDKMKIFKNRKGLSLHEAPAAIILLVVAGVAASVGALITTNIQTVITSNVTAADAGTKVAYYAAGNATSGVAQFSTMLPIIGIVIGAAIVIGLLFAAFFSRGMEAGAR
jgi:hypothetical protein